MDAPSNLKDRALAALRERLRADLEAVSRSQQATEAGATHEETRAENAKDTRAIEAQYLARGLAERAEGLEADLFALTAFTPAAAPTDGPIGVGALVTLEDEGGATSRYLVAPVGGGQKLELDGETVQVITPTAPLARQLVGRRVDDEIRVQRPRGRSDATIVEVR
ncbi:MAG: GreA/GreB family elongation factor [Myxococcota bacterium]|nr:GreA/GreB family elongation factor [Myxococcota bacterium]